MKIYALTCNRLAALGVLLLAGLTVVSRARAGTLHLINNYPSSSYLVVWDHTQTHFQYSTTSGLTDETFDYSYVVTVIRKNIGGTNTTWGTDDNGGNWGSPLGWSYDLTGDATLTITMDSDGTTHEDYAPYVPPPGPLTIEQLLQIFAAGFAVVVIPVTGWALIQSARKGARVAESSP